MNKYESPKVEVIELEKNDVITLSGGGATGNTGGGGLDFD